MIQLLLLLLVDYCLTTCPCSNPQHCNMVQLPPRREFFVFGAGDSNDFLQFDWTHLTTICPMWQIPTPPPSLDLVCYAHSKGVRVVSIAGMATSDLANASFIDQWVSRNIQYIQQNYLDGINVDFEDEIDENDHRSRHLFTEAIVKLKTALDAIVPGAQLTIDVGWLPNVDKRYYEYAKLSVFSDFLFVMAYDEQSAIYGPCKAGPTSSYPNLVKGINAYLDLGIQPEKLIAGLPWYGHDYPCINQVNHTVCPIAFAPWRGVKCTDANAPEYAYNDILTKFLPHSTTGIVWDAPSRSPYLDYIDESGDPHQVWFDNKESNFQKVKWSKLNGKLRGVGVFTVDFLDYSNKSQVKDMWEPFNYFFE